MSSLLSKVPTVRPGGRPLRFWPLCVVLPALALLPAPASAQTPTGEQAPTGEQIRAQARAFGEAALALETERTRLKPRLVRALGKREGSSRCLLELDDAKGEFELVGPFILLADILPPAARVFSAAVDRFVDQLEAAGPGEPILAAGAAGWRKSATVYRRLAAIRSSSCSLIRVWKRSGFRRSATPPEATALNEALAELGRPVTALARAERRLLQLGVKSRAARAFNADLLFGDAFFGGGGAYGSTEVIREVGVSPVF